MERYYRKLEAVCTDEGAGLNAGGLAVDNSQLAVDKDVLHLTLDLKALVGSVVDILMLVGSRNGPLDAGVVNGDVCIGANHQRTLLGVEVKQFCSILAQDLVDLNVIQIVLEMGQHQDRTMLDACAAAGDLIEALGSLLLLQREVEGAVVGGDGLDLTVDDGFLQGLAVGLLPDGGREDELGAVGTGVNTVVEQQVLGQVST